MDGDRITALLGRIMHQPERVDDRLTAHDRRFDAVDARLDRVDARLRSLRDDMQRRQR